MATAAKYGVQLGWRRHAIAAIAQEPVIAFSQRRPRRLPRVRVQDLARTRIQIDELAPAAELRPRTRVHDRHGIRLVVAGDLYHRTAGNLERRVKRHKALRVIGTFPLYRVGEEK